jgi:hypothetical protein
MNLLIRVGVGALILPIPAAPIAASELAANCDRPGVLCGPQAPRPADSHGDYDVRPLGTNNYVDAAPSGPPGLSDADAASMDALLYPKFIGVRPRPEPPFTTTGTQEGLSLWD